MEGRGCRDYGVAAKKQKCSLGGESWFYLKGYTIQYLCALYRTKILYKWKMLVLGK